MKRLLLYKYLIPVLGPIRRDGALLLDDDIILEMGTYNEVKTFCYSHGYDYEVHDYRDGIIMPGFVNVHTHLDLSFKDKKIEAKTFSEWLLEVVAFKRSLSEDEIEKGIMYGAKQMLESGVCFVGDISSFPYRTYDVLKGSEMGGRVYFEYLALREEDVALNLAELKKALNGAKGVKGAKGAKGVNGAAEKEAKLLVGISPHSPYTVCAAGFKAVNKYINAYGYESAIHVGESSLEGELFLNGRGSLYKLIERLSGGIITQVAYGTSPIEYIRRGGYLLNGTLLIHANVLGVGSRGEGGVDKSFDEIRYIKRGGHTIAHCGRSHAYFSNPRFKIKELLEEGVNIALGTDSLLSNESLNFFEELRFVRASNPKIKFHELIKMSTLNGAIGLRLADGYGKVQKGKRYKLIKLECKEGGLSEDGVYEYILEYKGKVKHI